MSIICVLSVIHSKYKIVNITLISYRSFRHSIVPCALAPQHGRKHVTERENPYSDSRHEITPQLVTRRTFCHRVNY